MPNAAQTPETYRAGVVCLAIAAFLFCGPTRAQETERTPNEPSPRSVLTELPPFLDIKELIGPSETNAMPDRSMVAALTGRTVIRVSADNPPPGFDPVADAAIPLGIPFHASQIRSAVLRLFETGRYRDIQIGARPLGEKQVELVISVLPMLRIRKLTVRGNTALKDDEVARAVGYTPGRTVEPSPEVLRAMKQRLLDRMALLGYPEAAAELSILTTEEPGGVELSVTVNAGKPDRYTSIIVNGLPSDVPPSVAGISEGFIRNEDKLGKIEPQLLENLAAYGYPDAEVLPMQERRTDRHALEMTLTVKPGLRTRVSYRGNRHFRSVELNEKLTENTPLRTDPETLARKEAALRQHYATHGFFFATVSHRRICLKENLRSEMPAGLLCPEETETQQLEFLIHEGEVTNVLSALFSDNERFTDEELENELFAFISEKNKNDDLFQPISPDTVDALGISDKQRDVNKDTDFKTPPFRRHRVYVPEQYAEGVPHLTGMYQEQGYLSATVDDTCDIESRRPIRYRKMTFTPLKIDRTTEDDEASDTEGSSPCVLVNREHNQILVLMRVNEGPKTEISELRFEGNRRLTSRELQTATGISVGAPYNEYRLREAARKVADNYRSIGYMFVDVSWQKSFSDDMQRAGVVFTITEGPITKVGLIRVEGAEVTSSRLIRERLTLNPGDIITPSALEKSQTLLMELGIFNGATVQMVNPENPEPVKNLRVQISEAKPQYMELRGGIATVEGVRGSFEYGFNNIGGLALNAALRARANYRIFFLGVPDFEQRYREMSLMEQLEHHVLVGLSSPHIPRTGGILGWGIDLIKERLNKPGFSASRFTTFLRLNAKVGIGAKYPHGLLFTAKTGMEYNLDISPGTETENPVLQSYLRLPEGKSAFSVIGLSAALDLRDSPFNPTQGFYLALEGDWVYSLPFVQAASDSNLIRAQATLSGYVPIFNTDIVLAMSVTAGYIFHLQQDSITWPDRYFYVGGVDTLRGFPEDDLVPEDIYRHWKSMLGDYGNDIDELLDNRGGEAMFITRAELRYPLAKGFYGAGFAEFGNLWRDREEMAPIVFSPSFKIQLRPVVGVGIRYQTPLGPIAFDLGVNLKRRPTELPLSWYISIGTAF